MGVMGGESLMERGISFGVRLPVAGPLASPANIREVAEAAERLGFDSIWVHDYLIWNRELDRLHISCGSREVVEAAGDDQEPVFYESLTNLAYLAGVTSTIRLGIAVLCLPYREPLLTAKQIACIDMMSGGRLELGVGQGGPKTSLNEEFEVLGISRATKVARTSEYLDAMKELWTMDAPEFNGRFTSFKPATIYPKPYQSPHPPIWIGGAAEASLELVATQAGGWLPCFLAPRQYTQYLEDLKSRFEAHGRDPDLLAVGTDISARIAPKSNTANDHAQASMDALGKGFIGTKGVLSGSLDSTVIAKEIFDASLVGDDKEIRQQVEKFVDVGCTHFELRFIYHSIPDLVDQMHQFSSKVMPDFI